MSISAIVPTYDRAPVIERAINSIRRQTRQVNEVIVVDDASTDDTSEVIDSLTIPHLTYVEHETNRGAAAARNTGLERAEGEIILFLDADDELHRRAVEKMHRVLVESRPDCVGVSTHYTEVTSGGQTVDVWNASSGIVRTEDLVEGLAIGGISGTMFLHSSLDAVGGFDERFPLSEDADLALRVSKEADLFVLDEPLLTAHGDSNNRLTNNNELYVEAKELFLKEHGDSLSNEYRSRLHANAWLAADKMGNTETAEEHLRKAISCASTDREIAYAHQYIGRILAHEGSVDHARSYFKKSLQWHPTKLSVLAFFGLAMLGDEAWQLARRWKIWAQGANYRLRALGTHFR